MNRNVPSASGIGNEGDRFCTVYGSSVGHKNATPTTFRGFPGSRSMATIQAPDSIPTLLVMKRISSGSYNLRMVSRQKS